MKTRIAAGCVLATTLLMATGCGAKLQPAGGTVSVDGAPVKCGGSIMFCPSAGGRPATGSIREDGTFTLSYEKEGDGLPPGEYKVVIIADIWKEAKVKSKAQLDEEAAMKRSGAIDDQVTNAGGTLIHVVPEQYNDISTTPLKYLVTKSEAPQQFAIDISSKKK